jgi:hypothetical protein
VKRLLALLSLTLAALTMGAAAHATQPNDRGPACSDITDGGSVYRQTVTNGTVTGGYVLTRIVLDDAVCLKQVTYTVYVIAGGTTYSTSTADPSTSTNFWAIDTINPNRLNFRTAFTNAPATVDIYVTTSTGDGNVNDRAPNSGFDNQVACPEGTDATGTPFPTCPGPGGGGPYT